MALTKAQKAAKAATTAAAAKKTAPPTGPEAPAIRETTSKTAGGVKATSRTVVVVCKMPRGLYLQHTKFIEQDQRVMGGGVEKRKVPMRIGESVRLKPTVLPFGTIPNYPIIDGFSLTRDVDADFWNTWHEQNASFGLITEGLLAAFDTEANAAAYCREFGKKKHGLEPLLQKDDPRIERSTSTNLTDIDIDTDTPRAA